MKKLLFISLVLLLACVEDPGLTQSNKSKPGPGPIDTGIGPLCCSCNNTCCLGSLFEFGIDHGASSVTSIVGNVHWSIIIKTRPYPLSLTTYKSDIGGEITYRITNFGTAKFKYKGAFGNWVTLNAGSWGQITKQIIPFNCSKNLGVETINTEVMLLDCPGGQGQINVKIEPVSITNGHTLKPNWPWIQYIGAAGCPL